MVCAGCGARRCRLRRCAVPESAPAGRRAAARGSRRFSDRHRRAARPATSKQTRFVLDLDRKIDLRAFTLADPTGWSSTSRRSLSSCRRRRRGRARPGQGVPLRPGDAGRLAHRDRPDEAGARSRRPMCWSRERPAGAAGGRTVGDRPRRPSCAPVARRTGRDRADIAGRRQAADAPCPRPADARPLIVIDPGHGGIDNGTQAERRATRRAIVLDFALALRDQLEKAGKYRVVMTRADDTFIPLAERVRIARSAAGRAVHLDPCRCAAARRGRCAGRDRLHAVGHGLRRRGRAARRSRKPGRRDRRHRPDRGADRRRRHPDRPGAARNQDLLKPLCPDSGGRDEERRAPAQESAEIGRLPGAARRRTCRRCCSNSATCPTRRTSSC